MCVELAHNRHIYQVFHLAAVEVALIALFLQVRVHNLSSDGAAVRVLFKVGAVHVYFVLHSN